MRNNFLDHLVQVIKRFWVLLKYYYLQRKKRQRLRYIRQKLLVAVPVQALSCVSVIIPALNEARRIADVVAYALSDPATAEVIVIDDGSTDDTASLARQAGAKVFTSSMLGKGASMQDGVGKAEKEILVYLDGDLKGLKRGIITDLCLPILREDADFVKARFGRGGGRVTELTAKPMIKIFFPEIAHLAQPLGGMIAARKSLLCQLEFEDGYGVDIGLVIDAQMVGAKVVEVDIGSLEHESQPLTNLAEMATEVSRVIFHRARQAGRLNVEQISAMFETQRQAMSEISYTLARWKGGKGVVLLDMDGTISASRFVVELARATGKEEELAALLDKRDVDKAGLHDYEEVKARSCAIAGLFKFVHKRIFEQVARSMVIRPDVVLFVKEMRRRGFLVGVISDSYFLAADIIRRRIFADFALAHLLTFDHDVCTGNLQINSAFVREENGRKLSCKSSVLRCLLSETKTDEPIQTWAVGDNMNDLELLKASDRAFVIEPKDPNLVADTKIVPISSFSELLMEMPPKCGEEPVSLIPQEVHKTEALAAPA